jgi:hypothetical protein
MQTRLYRPNAANVAAEIIEGEAIIINVATGTYYNTEGIGGWIWERCAAGNDTAEIVAQGCARFEVSTEQFAADLQVFLDELKAEELVLETPATSSGEATVESAVVDRLPYRQPKLAIYRDLKDLLALDPPMPRLDAEPTPRQ